jgi:hypothetical protein
MELARRVPGQRIRIQLAGIKWINKKKPSSPLSGGVKKFVSYLPSRETIVKFFDISLGETLEGFEGKAESGQDTDPSAKAGHLGGLLGTS